MIKEENITTEATETDNKQAIIEIKDLHKTFGKNNHVLKGVDFSVYKGEDLVILGRSGSGKSVTIKCIVGLIQPDKGEINVFGENIL
jgi:phospholipid/cholesterol/gamma-HCH transport system ATP-binding protein